MNTIVQECVHNAIYNENTVIGYTLKKLRKNKEIKYCLRQP